MPTDPMSFNPPVGLAETIAPQLRRIVAPNPSPMTFRGTNTYLIGTDQVAVIDPGPEIDAHLQAILAAGDGRISHIIVTHAHIDHSPLSRALSRETGAPVYAFGDARAGQSDVMRALAASGLAGGGEGVDADFMPDIAVADGDTIDTPEWSLRVWHTPGHFGNHIALEWGNLAFTGDLVMNWSTSMVSPPDGDLTDFLTSCRKMAARPWDRFYAGHGGEIDDPVARLNWLIAHRQSREAQIIETLRTHGAGSARDLAARIYTDTPAALMGAAARNVFAHLVDLTGRGITQPNGPLSEHASFALI